MTATTTRRASSTSSPEPVTPGGLQSPRPAVPAAGPERTPQGEDIDPRQALACSQTDGRTPGGSNAPHRAENGTSTQRLSRGEDQSAHPADEDPSPPREAPGGRQDTRPAKLAMAPDAHASGGSNDTPADHLTAAAQGGSVGGGLDSGTGRTGGDDHAGTAGAAPNRPAGASLTPSSVTSAPRLDDPSLNAAAALVDDLERARIAAEHRIRILTRPADEADEDGMFRGHGIPADHPTPVALRAVAEALAGVEHQAVLEMQRALRRHPLGAWVKATKGVGEKQGARLLSAIGDPYWNARDQKARTVSALWAYCGLHTLPASRPDSEAHPASAGGGQTGGDPGLADADIQSPAAWVAARRQKGVRANWSTTAKTRAYLVAVSCMKSPSSPYRAVYDARREHTALTHPEWTAGHSHNDALRIVSKRILRDLWRAARDIHLAAEEDVA